MSNFGTLQTVDSPCPVVVIKLCNPGAPSANDTSAILVNAIIDTGADTSAVPESVIERLISSSGFEVENDVVCMESADGSSAIFELVRLSVTLYDPDDQVKFATFPPKELDMVSIPSASYAIIGRDFLKDLKISIDFKVQNWRFCYVESCPIH